MRKLFLLGLATGLIATSLKAQTLFTFGGTPVSRQEFLKVYQKNSLNKSADLSEPALREYLDLYSLFRMKVREAELIRLDTMQSIASELDNYRRQLAKNYLTDKEVTNRLMKEAYDRMKEEVRVAHILVSVTPVASPEDTLKAYRKIDSMYRAVTKGKASFADLAKQYSDDKGSRATGGDIGFMTALQTLYPFENAAYTTPPGKVSPVFRTQFGYHIVKVLDKRAARGEVQVAQILVNAPKSKGEEGIAAARRRVDSIQQQLKQGVPFEELVTKYSDDRHSVNNKGLMPQFGVGRMTLDFETAAYSLKQPGDVSQPIQTEYGFHIIKLVNKIPLQPYDSIRDYLKRRIDNDSRSKVAQDIFFGKVKQKHGFKEYRENLQPILAQVARIPDTGDEANVFHAHDFQNMNQPLFQLGPNKYLQSDFIAFAEQLTRGSLTGPRQSIINELYNEYVKRTVNDFEEHHLAESHPEFKSLMEEYRNGIMLFELMDRNVWGKASRDTVGLKSFYETHKNKYQWEPGFTGAVYHFKDEAALKAGMKLLGKNASAKDEDVYKEINTEASPDAVSIHRSHFEFSRFKEVPRSAIVKGKLTEPVKNSDGSYTVVLADQIFTQPTGKTLDEARGYAVAEYQDFLEKQWNDQLRKKYPVKVDETVFKGMVK